MLLTSACTCGTGVEGEVFACTTPADCLDGWSCVQGICFPRAPVDAGPVDAGPLDAGPRDSGEVDAGVDAGADAAADAGRDAGPVDAGRPHVRTFADSFAGPALDTGRWIPYANGGASVAQSMELVITVPARDAGYAGVISRQLYDFRDGGLRVDLVDSTGATQLQSCEMYLSVNVHNPDGGRPDSFFTTIYSTRMHAYVWLDGGVSRRLNGFSFDPRAMHLIRMREERGQLLWEYSGDGGAWTVHFQMATPLDVSAVELEVGAGTWDNEDAGVRSAWRDLRGL